MLRAERIQTMFDEAAALHAKGQHEGAVGLVGEIISGSAVQAVRERASVLFGEYIQHVDRTNTSKSSDGAPIVPSAPFVPPAVHHTPGRSFPTASPVKQRTIQVQVRSVPPLPRQPTAPRIHTIESATRLPTPLCDHIIAGLRLSNGTKFKMPKSFLPVIQEIERLTATFAKTTTQQTLAHFLETVLGFFPNTSEKSLVFVAIVNIFYANDYIDATQAKELSFLAPGEGVTKTVREILSDVE